MGRPRGFDESSLIHDAIALFGRRGFDAITVDVLIAELGVSRASLYKIYGSKQGLFSAALDDVLGRAQTQPGTVSDADKDLVLVTLLELAPIEAGLRERAAEAVRECFDADPAAVGDHLLRRAGIDATR